MTTISPLSAADQYLTASHPGGPLCWHRSCRLRWLVNGLLLMTLAWVPVTLLTLLGHHVGASLLSRPHLEQATITWAAAVLAGLLFSGMAEAKRLAGIAQHRQNWINAIEAEQLRLRTLGDASEQQVADRLKQVGLELDPHGWLGSGMVMRYPQTQSGQMAHFEVDCLLVTRFGLFLVEVKNWKHPLVFSAAGWSLHKPSGTEPVKSALAQSEPKRRVLQELAEQYCPGQPGLQVHSLVVLTHPQASFPQTATANILYLDDVRHYLRNAYWHARNDGMLAHRQFGEVSHAIGQLHDKRPHAKHEFMLELAQKRGDSSGYLALDARKRSLQQLAPPLSRPYWMRWRMVLPLLLWAAAEWAFFGWQFTNADTALPVATSRSPAPHDKANRSADHRTPRRHARSSGAAHSA